MQRFLFLFLTAFLVIPTASHGFLVIDDDDDYLLDTMRSVLSGAAASVPKPRPNNNGNNLPGSTSGTLKMQQSGNRLIIRSTKKPTWKVEFAVGSGAPGGGTAVALYVPSDSTNSVVESQPGRACCSAVGLDNLEWRWRPFGGTNGTRSSVGLSSRVSRFQILQNTTKQIRFRVQGSWDGVRAFTRTTTVTPDGYTTTMDATYSGTTGQDSMWWIIALFKPSRMNGGAATIQDNNTAPKRLGFTRIGTPLPSGIDLPYTITYPLTSPARTSARLTVSQLAQNAGGNPRMYEFFNRGDVAGNYYLTYPRWVGSFRATTYKFKWSWRFSS